MIRSLLILAIACFISSWSAISLAGDYHVEIIVFKNVTAYPSHDSRNYDPPEEIPSFAAHWEATELKLEEQLKKIDESENYQILLHHAWQQESLPYSESAALEFQLDPEIHNQFAHIQTQEEIRAQEQLELEELQRTTTALLDEQKAFEPEEAEEEIENQPLVNQAISGWIKIYAKTLLFAQLDLDYFGYRLKEKRRLLLDEVHYLDHPKIGILLQVTRVEKTEEDEKSETTEEKESPAKG